MIERQHEQETGLKHTFFSRAQIFPFPRRTIIRCAFVFTQERDAKRYEREIREMYTAENEKVEKSVHVRYLVVYYYRAEQ